MPPPTTPTAVAAATPRLSVRVLPPEEWSRLSAFAPFDQAGLPDPLAWRIVVAELAGPGTPIVAFSCLFDAVHLEPLWVDPALRARPHLFVSVLSDLWRESRQLLTEAGVRFVFATSDDRTTRAGAFLEHLGFQRSPGDLYFVPVSQVRLPEI